MASTNQSPQYQKAEAKFLAAKTDEERLIYLEEMIRECPKHKSAEAMLSNLRSRRKKLLEKIEKTKQRKSKKSSKLGIKKEEMQAVIIGPTNTGKSSLLNVLTNANSEIASYNFTTKHPIIGMLNYNGIKVQLVDIPAIESEYFDKSTAYTTDTILILIDSLEQLLNVSEKTFIYPAKKIIVLNKIDLLSEKEKRKISAFLQSKKLNFTLISCKTKEGIEELKEKIFRSFNKIRIFTKEPGKEKSERPFILEPNSTVKDIAEKIFHGFSLKIKETKIWGPSSKFPKQKVGLSHILKDLDVVEFKTK